jgi:hypothetical protein
MKKRPSKDIRSASRKSIPGPSEYRRCLTTHRQRSLTVDCYQGQWVLKTAKNTFVSYV